MSKDYRPEYKFEIEEYDDKKEKWQSCECSVTETVTQFYIIEYGATPEEAKEKMLEELDRYIDALVKFREELR